MCLFLKLFKARAKFENGDTDIAFCAGAPGLNLISPSLCANSRISMSPQNHAIGVIVSHHLALSKVKAH